MDMNLFWSRVVEVDDHWLWKGALDAAGYGIFQGRRAHRITYEQARGPVPDGLELDHLCRVRNCVNPDHLEAVTHRENLLRGETIVGINARKTHCPKGHPYDEANTYLDKKNGKRQCVACRPPRTTNHRERGAGTFSPYGSGWRVQISCGVRDGKRIRLSFTGPTKEDCLRRARDHEESLHRS